MPPAVTAALLFAGGYAYLSLVGWAAMLVLLPRRWAPYGVVVAPLYGWAVLAVAGYFLAIVLPFTRALPIVGTASVAALVWTCVARRRAFLRLVQWRPAWREAAWPLVVAAASYAVGAGVYVRQGYLAMVVVDRDAERYYDTVASLLRFPLGWHLAAVQGLEGTPVGPPYYVVHGLLAWLSGLDTYTTALPSHLLMASLAVPAVYLFARSAVSLSAGGSRLACGLYALGGTPLIVASLGFPHQTSALAALPFGLAALAVGLGARGGRALGTAGLGAALAGLSNYPVTVPLVAAWAAALAVAAAWSRRAPYRPLAAAGRVALIGALAAAGGAPTHLTVLDYVRARLGQGMMDAADVAQRSVHVSTFASPAAALGVAPLDPFRDVRSQDGAALLRWSSAGPAGAFAWLAAAAGVALLAAGAVAAARRPPLVAAVAGAAPFFVYFRVISPFPYWEFKLITAAWFLLPCLVALGAASLRGAGPRTLARAVLIVFAAGLVMVQAHAARFLSLPWGGGLPEREVAAARQITRAVPPGASVYASAQLTPLAAREWAGAPIHHARGSPSRPAGASYLSQRWRGVVTTLLDYADRPVYGLLRRDTNDVVLPVDPRATDYLLLDESEDPRLYGVLPSDLALSAGTLRLYRQHAGPAAVSQLLALPPGGADPHVVLDVRATGSQLIAPTGEPETGLVLAAPGRASLPMPVLTAKHLRLPLPALYPWAGNDVPAARAAATAVGAGSPGRGNLVVGFQVLAPVHLAITLRDASGEEVRRDQGLLPGLTWYTTPALRWPADIRVVAVSSPGATAPADASSLVRPVGVITANSPAAVASLAEDLERSSAGTVWPLLTVVATEQPGGGVALDAWYSYDGPREGPSRAQLRDTAEPWGLGGTPFPTLLHLGPGGRIWRAVFAPGTPPDQWSSEGRQLTSPAPVWPGEDGQHWLWLEAGPHGDVAYHEPALLPFTVQGGRARVTAPPVMATVFPLLAEPAPPPVVPDGTLVKGSGDDLFYVERGRLRWVASLDALERHHVEWRLTVLDDAALQRLPVGLPLT